MRAVGCLFPFVAAFLFVYRIPPFVCAGETSAAPIPRTIVALYLNQPDGQLHWSQAHQLAEMPLNHLGLKVVHHNLERGLPQIKDNPEIRGVLTWFDSGTRMENPSAYLKWATELVAAGKKLVVMGGPGFWSDKKGVLVPSDSVNRLLNRLGLKCMDNWVDFTYDLRPVYLNPEVMEFERRLAGIIAPYRRVISLGKRGGHSHLVVRKGGNAATDAHLVATGSAGGYIADGYALFVRHSDGKEFKQWYVNPFQFFRLAFATRDMPKPDTTTVAGRRIYYSHIDGDGWNNVSQIEEYQDREVLSSRVVLEKAIKAYPGLPVTVAPVVAELDEAWSGRRKSLDIAGEIFAQANVEVGSHTFSHPFDWDFFKDGNPETEQPYLHKYPGGGWKNNRVDTRFLSIIRTKDKPVYDYNESGLSKDDYERPRAYAAKPFDIDLELTGSAAFLNRLAPPGKRVRIIMWSGDTTPFEEAIRIVRRAGLQNINGGDSRFDREYPSYAWISPIGRSVGGEHQIYSSNSNENTYTDLWSDRFHGFRYLIQTVENTDIPFRIKPFNLYYHMYSGEKRASLEALMLNLEYAASQEIAPLTASRYAGIAQGFYTTRMVPLGKRRWRIENRGELQTIRFDFSSFSAVDFNRSRGIVGQRHYQGSLYVYLDEKASRPVVALKRHDRYFEEPREATSYLIQGRWRVWSLSGDGRDFRFFSRGFGTSETIWRIPADGYYTVRVFSEKKSLLKSFKTQSIRGVLKLSFSAPNNGAIAVVVKYTGKP
ncbi:MAG: hypothetical protein GY866_27785 [Proteobacteria bacterium]|nr:hypothetical protein [Pseudomonadota bacterium]